MTRRRTQAATAAPSIQAGGRSREITHKGQTKRLSDWADLYGISRKTFTSRLARGATFEEAIAEVDKKYVSRDEVEARRQKLYDIVEEQQPIIVRAVFYQAVVKGIVAKDDRGAKMVGADLVLLRKEGRLPYEWIVDNTRSVIKPYAYASVTDALAQTADNYRADLWKDADELVIIFLEKDGLAGVIQDTTLCCGVPLYPARGYASLSFLNEIATDLRDETRPVFCYMLGDWDPSGVDAHRFIEDTMRELAPGVDFRFKRLGLTQAQIKKWKLPTRPTKDSDTRSVNWTGGASVELDAVEPKVLRKLVKDAIDKHMDAAERLRIRTEETNDRAYIAALADQAREDRP
jgi:hypothetical protein